MISIEQYADLCALMADTGGDVNKENAIAAAHGVSPEVWAASKAGFTAKMSDPNDMGRTAMAFMPLYQAAQARARGGKEPCTLEFYTKVHAEILGQPNPRFDPAQAQRFRVMMQAEADRINGIVR